MVLVFKPYPSRKFHALFRVCYEGDIQYTPRNMHTVCFAVLCCGYTLTDFPLSIRLTSLALWQSNDCPSASKATLMNMDKYFMWIHYERLHNHNKAKHNKTVCIFLGIYCMFHLTAHLGKWCLLHSTIRILSVADIPVGILAMQREWRLLSMSLNATPLINTTASLASDGISCLQPIHG